MGDGAFLSLFGFIYSSAFVESRSREQGTYDVLLKRLTERISFRSPHIRMALDLRVGACVVYNRVALRNPLLISGIRRTNTCMAFHHYVSEGDL